MATARANSDLDCLSTVVLQSDCSGDCFEPQDPKLQDFLREQRILLFRADESPVYTRARSITIAAAEAEGVSRMEDILADLDRQFDAALNKPRL